MKFSIFNQVSKNSSKKSPMFKISEKTFRFFREQARDDSKIEKIGTYIPKMVKNHAQNLHFGWEKCAIELKTLFLDEFYHFKRLWEFGGLCFFVRRFSWTFCVKQVKKMTKKTHFRTKIVKIFKNTIYFWQWLVDTLRICVQILWMIDKTFDVIVLFRGSFEIILWGIEIVRFLQFSPRFDDFHKISRPYLEILTRIFEKSKEVTSQIFSKFDLYNKNRVW